MSNRFLRLAPGVLLLLIFGTLGSSALAHDAENHDAPEVSSEKDVIKRFGPLPNLLGKGEAAYKHMCVFCHGEDGNGGGKATAYLYPWPRDFRKGIFKYRTTPPGSLPLDQDIYRTISRGVPGTAMPAWKDSLTEKEIWSLVFYLKTFSERFNDEPSVDPVQPTVPPATTTELVSQGKSLYGEIRCGRCHGIDLRGDGSLADNLYDIWDHRSFVYDLTNPNLYKWGYRKEEIYMTLTTGVEGTPMKAYGHLSEEERWALAAFLNSRIEKETFQEARFESELRVKKVAEKNLLDPRAAFWKQIPVNEVQLMPLNARKKPIHRMRFQGVLNSESIAFRLRWKDSTPNRSSSRHQDFKDAIAMQFALGDVMLHRHGHNEPFYGMGNRGKAVNIWQWRADWQQDIETKEKLEYATKGMDMDGMIFGGEVNPVDSLNPFRNAPVEELNAEGFGTLTAQPQTKQNINGFGFWDEGLWTVVISRDLDVLNKWDIKFNRDKETPILVAFAVWDGAFRDIDGRKSVAMWQKLFLPKN